MQGGHPPPSIFMLKDQRHIYTPSEHALAHGEVKLQVESAGGHVHGLGEVFESKRFASFDRLEGFVFRPLGLFFVEEFQLNFALVGVRGDVLRGVAEAIDVGQLGRTDGGLARTKGVNEGHDG